MKILHITISNLVFLFVLNTNTSLGQQAICGFDDNVHALFQARPDLQELLLDWRHYISTVKDTMNAQLYRVEEPNVIRIPTVVHFIGSGFSVPSPGEIEDVVDLVLDRANQCLRRQYGSVGFGDGVDTYFELCRAKFNENGLYSNGIDLRPDVEGAPFARSSSVLHQFDWDPTRYCNISVADLEQGISGFGVPVMLSSFFGFDGINIDYEYFFPNFWDNEGKQGKTLVHEFGHYMGLSHVFEKGCDETTGNCAIDGDGCCDTPPCRSGYTSNSYEYCWVGCSANQSTCFSNNSDPLYNYMHYNLDNCLTEFTLDQRAIMLATLQNYRQGFYSDISLCSLPSQPSCSDGIMGPGEIGVDCGGTCPPCYSPAGGCNAGMPDYFMPDTSNHNWGCNWIRYRQITNCLRGNLDGTYRKLYYEKAVIGSDDFYYSGGKTYVNAAIPSGLSGGWCWYSSDMPYIHLTPGFGIFASEDDEIRIGLAYVGNPAWWNGSCEGEPCPSSVAGERLGQENSILKENHRKSASYSQAIPTLFPNPTTGHITLQAPEAVATVQVLELTGRVLQTVQVNQAAAPHGETASHNGLGHSARSDGAVSIDLSPYQPGTYLLRAVYVGGKAEVWRVVRQ